MPKKGKELLPMPMGEPDFSNILSADIPVSLKRQKILVELGLRTPKKKYASAEERKAAAKERTKKRKGERVAVLKKYGLEPKPKAKKTKAEKRERSKERARTRRELFKEFARMHPEIAKKYGFNPKRFKP